MRFLFIVILLDMQCSSGEGNNHLKKESSVVFTDEYEEVDGPPKDFKSNFSSLHDWLKSIVDSEQQGKVIETFSFGLLESTNNYTMYLVGLQTEKKNDSSITNIVFKPKNMYYQLQKNEVEDLSRNQILNNIKSELKKFIDSDKFKSSFFVKSKSVILEYDGIIWSNDTDR